MVTIWNPTDEAQTFIFRLMFAGGRQYDDVMTLGPRATKMFDVSEILSTGGPDQEGNIIPAGVQEGSAQIVGLEADNQHILLALDAGVYNVRKATCTSPCTTCYGATIWSVSVDPFSLAVGGQTQEHFYAQWNNGGQYEYTSNSTWTSNATGVATVQTGLVKGASVGSLTISSSIYGEPVAVQLCGSEAPSCPMYGGGGSSSPGTVGCPNPPTSESTSYSGPNGSNPTTSNFNMTLSGGSGNFSGWTVAEYEAQQGADSCWTSQADPFYVPEYPQVQGSSWTVSSGKSWGPDVVGWTQASVNYIRQNSPLYSSHPIIIDFPCGYSVHQALTISCPQGTTPNLFDPNVLQTGTVEQYDVKNCREGVCSQINH